MLIGRHDLSTAMLILLGVVVQGCCTQSDSRESYDVQLDPAVEHHLRLINRTGGQLSLLPAQKDQESRLVLDAANQRTLRFHAVTLYPVRPSANGRLVGDRSERQVVVSPPADGQPPTEYLRRSGADLVFEVIASGQDETWTFLVGLGDCLANPPQEQPVLHPIEIGGPPEPGTPILELCPQD